MTKPLAMAPISAPRATNFSTAWVIDSGGEQLIKIAEAPLARTAFAPSKMGSPERKSSPLSSSTVNEVQTGKPVCLATVVLMQASSTEDIVSQMNKSTCLN